MHENTANERRLAAFHEAGHAIVALSLGGSVQYVSVVDRVIRASVPQKPLEKAAYHVAGEVGEGYCDGADPMDTCAHTAADIAQLRELAVSTGTTSPTKQDEFLKEALELAQQHIGRNYAYFEKIVAQLIEKGELNEADMKRIEKTDL